MHLKQQLEDIMKILKPKIKQEAIEKSMKEIKEKDIENIDLTVIKVSIKSRLN